MSEERTFNIDGKDYKESELPLDVRNTIIARAEIQQSKVRHEVELEKIEVLTNYYNNKIKEGLQKINGGGSKSTD
jgi:argininosuccinate lyase